MAMLTVGTALAIVLPLGIAAGQKPSAGKLLLQWTSRQQMNWRVRLEAQGFRFLKVVSARLDAGGKQKAVVSPDGSSLDFDSDTSWNTGSALVEYEPREAGEIVLRIGDRYVADRLIEARCTLQELKAGKGSPVTSVQWPMTGCQITLTAAPAALATEAGLLKSLGTDRRKNIEALLAAAGKAESKTRRTELLLRAAAACTGGCNHGPLLPDGWDRAIAIYQKVIDENGSTDVGLDALWLQASCYACWSPQSGCDADGRGKGYSAGREKKDWEKACELYDKLYLISREPCDKADALRRKAELQFYEMGEGESGLETYRKIALEFTGPLPPSKHPTYRTCAPHCGTDLLAWDIYRALVACSDGPKGVREMFDLAFGKVKGNPYVDQVREWLTLPAKRLD